MVMSRAAAAKNVAEEVSVKMPRMKTARVECKTNEIMPRAYMSEERYAARCHASQRRRRLRHTPPYLYYRCYFRRLKCLCSPTMLMVAADI